MKKHLNSEVLYEDQQTPAKEKNFKTFIGPWKFWKKMIYQMLINNFNLKKRCMHNLIISNEILKFWKKNDISDAY